MGTGKAKGGEFEREVCRKLSLWWTEGKRDDIFYRTHSSGGRFTMRRKAKKDTALQGGDITASDPIGEPLVKIWSIEAKTGYGTKTKTGIVRWDVLDVLDSQQKETTLEKMWAQCERDAILTNRIPILIFRRNLRQACIVMNTTYFEKLVGYFGSPKNKYIAFSSERITGFILPLTTFFDWVPNIRAAL